MKPNKDSIENAYSLLRILNLSTEQIRGRKYKEVDKTFKDVRKRIENFKREVCSEK